MQNRFRDRDDRERGNFEDREYDNKYYRDRSRRFGGQNTFDHGENYFGGGRQGYGEGIESYEPNRAFGESWHDSTGLSNYDYPERRYDSVSRRAGFGRDAYGLGYGGDWEPEANRRRYQNQPYQPNQYQPGYQGQTAYGSEYPHSESGFDLDRSRQRGWWDKASDEVSSWFGDEHAEHRRHMDRLRGNRGRGPKNYTRSDERIREDINDRLTDYDYIDASDIDVNVQNSEVILTGIVDSRYEKRMAEDVAEKVSGVSNVENRLRVRREQQGYAGNSWTYSEADNPGSKETERARGTSSS
jgi:osmotically-inducible protein OsmY